MTTDEEIARQIKIEAYFKEKYPDLAKAKPAVMSQAFFEIYKAGWVAATKGEA